jgi:hypothetical protein
MAMAFSKRRRADIEGYWQAYFAQLDDLSPHEPNTRAAPLTRARRIISYDCKDGLLMWFEERPELDFEYKSSGLTVNAMFNRLTDPVGLNWDKFPTKHDFGPVFMAEVQPNQRTAAPVLFYRAVWWLGTPRLKLSDAVRRAADDHEQKLKPDLWGIEADKARKGQQKKH